MPSLRGLFEGANKYLLILLVLFLCMIGLLLRQKTLMTKQATQIKRRTPKFVPRVPLTPIKDLVAKNTKQYPMNQIMFEDVKRQLHPNEKVVSEGRTPGKVLKSELTPSSISILMETHLPNMNGSQIWFVYGPETMSKVKVQSEKNPGKTATAKDILPGGEIYIDEKNDYSLTYPQSIQSVTITLL